MIVRLAREEREKKPTPESRLGERGSVNEILLACYRRFARDPHTRQAVKLFLERGQRRVSA